MKNYLKNNHSDPLNLEEVLLLRYAREMSEFT